MDLLLRYLFDVPGGGKDGKIVKYTPELRLTGEEANLPPHLGSVRVIAQGVGNQVGVLH